MQITQDMTALVTGGSSGIGLEYARQLAGKGCRLLLVSNREEELNAAGKEIKDIYKVEVQTRFQNLAEQGAAEQLHQYCTDNNIAVDILVCNAGMFFFNELQGENIKKAEAMVNLHVVTNTKLINLFGSDMKSRGRGIIILMSSLAAKLPVPGIAIYSATKAYLRNLGKALWHELRPYGVSITTVCPGAIATPLYGLDPKLIELGVKVGAIKRAPWLVKKVLKAAQKGKCIIEPAFSNACLPALLGLVPSKLENKIWVKYRR